MTEYTDMELAEFLAQRAKDVHLYADKGLPGYKVMADKYEAAAARLRARSEDTERLISIIDRLHMAALHLASGGSVRDLDEICSAASAAIDSARKRGE